jgi:hypothetical protein
MARIDANRTGSPQPRSRKPTLCSSMAILGLLALSVAAAAVSSARPVRKVALAGDPAPGTGGAVFAAQDSNGQNGMDETSVNSSGDVVFGASFTGSSSGAGIWIEHFGTLSAVALSGQTVPNVGTLQAPWALNWDGPALNNSGTVVFVALNAVGGPAANAIVQKTLTGSLTALVRQGDAAPGTSGVFDSFDDLTENDNGDVAFIATYIEFLVTKSGVFLRSSSGAITNIIKNGDPLPGTGGSTFCGTAGGHLDGPFLNNLGVVAFHADRICLGASESATFEGSLFATRPGLPVEAFVLLGDAAPPALGGTISDVSVSRPGLNDANTVAFKAEITGPGFCMTGTPCGILTKTLGGSSQVCVTGDSSAPGTTGTFSDFNAPTINQQGLATFEASVQGDSTVTDAVFTCKGGSLKAIAFQGDPKPGTAATFGNSLSDVVASDSGLVSFADVAASGSGAGANEGIFVGGAAACGGIDPSTSLCVNGGRFAVSATFNAPTASGTAHAVQLTPDTGYLWFFSASNVEAVVKVINGCSLNNRFWVFAGGLTNVKVVLTVKDSLTGAVNTHTNQQNTQFQPIQDTSAFATCSAADIANSSPEAAAAEFGEFAQLQAKLIPQSVNGTSLLLNGDRFRIDVTWRTPDGHSGTGMPVALTGDTGYFWFFASSNVEMVIKVLNGCSLGGHYWVFAGGLTNVRTDITVTDTQTGKVKPYFNPQGKAFQPIQDTSAFVCP